MTTNKFKIGKYYCYIGTKHYSNFKCIFRICGITSEPCIGYRVDNIIEFGILKAFPEDIFSIGSSVEKRSVEINQNLVDLLKVLYEQYYQK